MGNRGAAPQERMNDPVKATTAIGAAPGSAAGKPTAAVTLFWCLMGLLLPRATLYGELAPFGISLAAAATGGTLPVTASLIAGYLLSVEFARVRGTITEEQYQGYIAELQTLPEKIDKIMTSRLKEADLSQDSNGIGLDNVIGRLRLFLKTEDNLEILSGGKNQGTEVRIYLPIPDENI